MKWDFRQMNLPFVGTLLLLNSQVGKPVEYMLLKGEAVTFHSHRDTSENVIIPGHQTQTNCPGETRPAIQKWWTLWQRGVSCKY